MSMMGSFRVDEETFLRFIAEYQRHRPLRVDVCAIPEPPIVTYNDFTLGTWPTSVVADQRAGMRACRGLPAEPRYFCIRKPWDGALNIVALQAMKVIGFDAFMDDHDRACFAAAMMDTCADGRDAVP